jgi:hypothetical protein
MADPVLKVEWNDPDITATVENVAAGTELIYRLSKKDGNTWTEQSKKTSKTAKATFRITPPAEDQSFQVTVEGTKADGPLTAQVTVPKGAASANPADEVRVFEPWFALCSAVAVLALFGGVAYVLLRYGVHRLPAGKELYQSTAAVAGLIALGLLLVGLLIAAVGTFMMLVEQRSTMEAAASPAATREAIAPILEAAGKLKPAWATMAAAVACFLAAAWVGGKIVDGPPATTTTTTTAPTAATTSAP